MRVILKWDIVRKWDVRLCLRLKQLHDTIQCYYYMAVWLPYRVGKWLINWANISLSITVFHAIYRAYIHGVSRKIRNTAWCRVVLEKLTGLQLVNKFPAFHGTRRFITALTSVRHLCLSWTSPIQSIYPHPTSCRSILILSTHLRLGLPSGIFPFGFPTKTLYTSLSSTIRATCPAHFKKKEDKKCRNNVCPITNHHSHTCIVTYLRIRSCLRILQYIFFIIIFKQKASCVRKYYKRYNPIICTGDRYEPIVFCQKSLPTNKYRTRNSWLLTLWRLTTTIVVVPHR